jgi:hypothetical protein
LLSSFLVSHVRRGDNVVAHALAKFALDSTDSVWIEEIPSCIVYVVATDLIHVLLKCQKNNKKKNIMKS